MLPFSFLTLTIFVLVLFLNLIPLRGTYQFYSSERTELLFININNQQGKVIFRVRYQASSFSCGSSNGREHKGAGSTSLYLGVAYEDVQVVKSY